MSEFNNCVLPDDLYYRVDINVWVRVLEDRTVQIGMTDIAQSMAGSIIYCHPQKAGKEIKMGKSLATVESDKWVGPVKSPMNGQLLEANAAVAEHPDLLNSSPYRQGWIVRLQPNDLEGELADMVQGDEAVAGFRAYMEDQAFSECTHCEGFEA